jgi:hypothetical protein
MLIAKRSDRTPQTTNTIIAILSISSDRRPHEDGYWHGLTTHCSYWTLI